MLKRLLAALLLAAVPLSAQRAAPTTTDVPVSKVVLFSSGVGYFEHSGVVHENGSTMLRFKTNQINDILKSLVLQDQDGGRVGAITYASQDPLAKTLRSFQVDITSNPSLAELLNQLRGASVTVQAHAETLHGTILGVEMHSVVLGEAKDLPHARSEVAVLNLLSGAMIRAVDLPGITSLSLDDPALQDELARALTALASARDQDKKPVTINFLGDGARRVRIGYVVETPIWKTSYRLVLDDRKTRGSLQGWAIVENQTESDWNNVSLSLVSGRPISFKMDLYQPLYANRPTVVQESYASLRPQVYDGGIAEQRERAPMSPANAPARKDEGMMAKSLSARSMGTMRLEEVVVTSAGVAAPMDALSSVEAIASAMKLGDLFHYTVNNVTLPRQKSAMLPIVTDSIAMERVSIYNASVLSSNPLNGVRLKNTTGKSLLQGPVTVFDKGGYAGDAQIDNLPAGQQRLLSYGIDLDITVDNTRNSQTSTVQTASIAKGVLTIKRKRVMSQEYAADNKSDRDRTLVIEHPINAGWKLVDTQAPVETTPTHYRFQGTATHNKVTTLTVKEEWVQGEAVAIIGADFAQLLGYSTTSEIPRDVRDALARAAQMRQGIADVERQIAARTQQINEISVEQNRIRENMKTVSSGTPYYTRLLEKLNEQESSIEKLQGERQALNARRDALRKDFEEYVSNLKVG